LQKNSVLERVKLSLFLLDLLQDGNVTLAREMRDFEPNDAQDALVLLREFYDRDVMDMPGTAPAFNEGAALWAARYLYHVCQLILLRDLGEDILQEYLKGFEGARTAEASYSADMVLRYLPDLFRLASGLSPNDPLVIHLQDTARQWPFSSVGINGLATIPDASILTHQSLRLAYIDRIIFYKDLSRLKGEQEKILLKEVLGAHQAILWPELVLLNNEETI